MSSAHKILHLKFTVFFNSINPWGLTFIEVMQQAICECNQINGRQSPLPRAQPLADSDMIGMSHKVIITVECSRPRESRHARVEIPALSMQCSAVGNYWSRSSIYLFRATWNLVQSVAQPQIIHISHLQTLTPFDNLQTLIPWIQYRVYDEFIS